MFVHVCISVCRMWKCCHVIRCYLSFPSLRRSTSVGRISQAAPDVSPPIYKNMRHAFATIYQKEGLRGFFVGFTPCLARAFPANAAAFTSMSMAY